MYLLVVIDLERLQELEVEGEAALHSDAVVAAQVRGVGPGVLQAGDVAGWLCVQLTGALGCESREGGGHHGLSGWPRSPCLAPASLPQCPNLTLAGMPILLKLIAWTAGTEVATNIVVTQVLALGLEILFN